jgi:hypothetical protein
VYARFIKACMELPKIDRHLGASKIDARASRCVSRP